MNFIKLVILLSSILLFSNFSILPFEKENAVHDIHVTKCNIDFSNEEKTLQITLHIYLDDLELAIKNGGVEERLHLCTEKEHTDGEKHVFAYFEKMFQLKVNGQPVSYNFLGKEPTKDLLGGWFYLEVENVQELKDLKINYGILTDLYNDQQSIVKVKGPNKKKGYFLLDSFKKEANATF